MERSNADDDPCINSVLVNILTKGQGGAMLPMEGTNLQELNKTGIWNQQVVNPVV